MLWDPKTSRLLGNEVVFSVIESAAFRMYRVYVLGFRAGGIAPCERTLRMYFFAASPQASSLNFVLSPEP